MRTRFATGGVLLVTQSFLLPTAEAQAADSGYSLITTGTCATTADCAAITTEADCRALHTLVDMEFGAGSGHFTVGSSQRSNVPAGCLFFSSASRHKFNDNMASTATCSATHRECSQRRRRGCWFSSHCNDTPLRCAECFCTGSCAPVPAHAAPESVADQTGTSGTGGSGSATSPCPPAGGSGGGNGGGEGGGGASRCSGVSSAPSPCQLILG